MNIVWFTWKDIRHPQAGGAENVSWHLMQNLQKHGHAVHIITARYTGSKARDVIDGIQVTRVGNRFTVYFRAFFAYRRLAKWAGLLIDEMNTIPFGCGFYSRKPRALLTYQLARRVWFYQMPFPLSWIGYFLEPIYLFLLSRRYHTVLTESESTRQDLFKYGFRRHHVGVFRVGLELKPLTSLPKKAKLRTVLVHGSVRPMKRTLDGVRAFETARDQLHDLRLIISGDDSSAYGAELRHYIARSRHAEAISMKGRVSNKQRIEYMRAAAIIMVTSIKEGWGLIVTEANSQGTPAITYDCDGLRDSVINGRTGLIVPSGNTAKLGDAVVELLKDADKYQRLRQAAWGNSKQYTFDNSYKDFAGLLALD